MSEDIPGQKKSRARMWYVFSLPGCPAAGESCAPVTRRVRRGSEDGTHFRPRYVNLSSESKAHSAFVTFNLNVGGNFRSPSRIARMHPLYTSSFSAASAHRVSRGASSSPPSFLAGIRAGRAPMVGIRFGGAPDVRRMQGLGALCVSDVGPMQAMEARCGCDVGRMRIDGDRMRSA